MITGRCQRCFLHPPHPLLPPLRAQVRSLHLRLCSRPVHMFISTIVLESVYICVCVCVLMYDTYFFSFWLNSLCIIGSRFIRGERGKERKAQEGGDSFICMCVCVCIYPSLEEGMATHSSTLAWRIPWTEEPDGLQSMGLQRVGHDWSDLACKGYIYIYDWFELYSRNQHNTVKQLSSN